MLPVSTLDIATDPESIELLIPDEILTYPPMSDYFLPPFNDTDSSIVLPEPEAKINARLLLSVYEPAAIVKYPPLLNND